MGYWNVVLTKGLEPFSSSCKGDVLPYKLSEYERGLKLCR
ncbi:hypothetical protein JH2_107 [Escherichia phage JH2]|uniref:Uncharacterized protein n=1 Tax=Escherichia phage JH2 TaxID=1340750 RepID=S5MC99_9CAUD|nr:hypothetical protein AVV43_gp107 [Escherichia phage JH2]AGR48503.1 hypothetical protein JH2_107 [Escherichia phage JH2]